MKPRSRNMKMDLACGNASFVGLDVYRDCEKPRIPCRQLGLLTDGGRIFEQSDIEAGFVKRAKEMGGDGLVLFPPVKSVESPPGWKLYDTFIYEALVVAYR